MSHLEERLEHDLNEIRDQIASMGTSVEQALEASFRALHNADDKLAFTTILSDLPINRQMRKIDQLCHAFIAVHLPSAGHLRLISSVIRANIILERIGDYAVTIAREAVQLGEVPHAGMLTHVEKISAEAISILGESISAFNSSNAERAREAMAGAGRLEREMDGVYAELLEGAESGSSGARDTLIYLIIFTQLKRVADQAKNLAEQTVFVETGETKQPKVYRILFLDEDNSCLGPMAELIAGKIYPDIGEYSSAGVHPAPGLNADMVSFMQDRGFNLSALSPRQLDTSRESLAKYHVIVGLHKKVLKTVVKIPFRTSALNWKDVDVPDSNDPQAWENLHKTLALHIRELLTLLRGDEAA
jgi:phosphate transport system protein